MISAALSMPSIAATSATMPSTNAFACFFKEVKLSLMLTFGR